MAFEPQGVAAGEPTTLKEEVALGPLQIIIQATGYTPRPDVVVEAGRKHLIIPDCQVKDGVDIRHLRWIGQYIVHKRPDVVVCIGDFADMPSLSSYDRGKKDFEGRRYKKDVEAAIRGMAELMGPLMEYNSIQAAAECPEYHPRLVMTLGNHEDRINRAVNEDARLDGTIGIADLRYKEFGWEVHPFLEVVEIDGVEYCMSPDTRVLKRDLTWAFLRDIRVGDSLIGFDDKSIGARKFRTAIVERADLDTAPVLRVSLSDGTQLKATAEHKWLGRKRNTGYGWIKTPDLLGCRLPRLFTPWTTNETRDAGWLAGIFDGEGWLSKSNMRQGGIQLGFAQNPGLVLSRGLALLDAMGFTHNEHLQNKPVGKTICCRVLGNSSEKLRLIGQIRPGRLIDKFKPEMLGRLQSQGDVRVVEIADVGISEIVKLKTSTGTFIAEGFPTHNSHYFVSGVMGRPVSSAAALLRERAGSAIQGHVQFTDLAVHRKTQQMAIFVGTCYLHDEDYLTVQGNDCRRQIVMLHEVNEGSFDPMFVSLAFLERRYGAT